MPPLKASVHHTSCNTGANLSSLQVIGTHNGTFHCDEALAVLLLRHTNEYRDASAC